MKSIKTTLKLVTGKLNKFSRQTGYCIKTCLIGGQAVIAFGATRTSIDVDICTVILDKQGKYVSGNKLADFLTKELPNFQVDFKAGTDPDDPLQHDFIRLLDKKQEYPVIDILFANYKWELEALKASEKVKNLPLPVFPKSYLVIMKLKAGGIKDKLDIIEMFNLMNTKEKKKTTRLASSLRLEKKLQAVLKL